MAGRGVAEIVTDFRYGKIREAKHIFCGFHATMLCIFHDGLPLRFFKEGTQIVGRDTGMLRQIMNGEGTVQVLLYVIFCFLDMVNLFLLF